MLTLSKSTSWCVVACKQVEAYYSGNESGVLAPAPRLGTLAGGQVE
jgi:hypothetical protein